MAKRSKKRKAPRRSKTRRRKATRARVAELNLKDQIPGYLFSAEAFTGANGGAYLPALFAEIPEDAILAALPAGRWRPGGPGRPPFPRRALLRALVARQAYAIPSYAQLQVRLVQDVILKYQCGFDLTHASPDEDTLSTFSQFLGEHVGGLKVGHGQLVDELGNHLPGLGEHTSWDSAYLGLYVPKAPEPTSSDPGGQASASGPTESVPAGGPAREGSGVPGAGESRGPRAASDAVVEGSASQAQGGSCSSPSSVKTKGKPQVKGKGKSKAKNRGNDQDKEESNKGKVEDARAADWGQKTYESVSPKSITLPNGQRVEGIEVKKTSSWIFGGKFALINDNRWHLPLLIEIGPASRADGPQIAPMYRDLTQEHRWMDVEYAMIDKAGDSTEVHRVLLEELGIVGIIPLREFANREAPAGADQEFAKTVYDRDRVTHQHHPDTGAYVEFEPWGYDASRQAVKYVCPCRRLRASGELAEDASCPFMGAQCGARHGRWPFSFWVPMSLDYRYYCPVPRESKRWAELYKERTTSERVNSVFKGPLGLGTRRLRCLATAACEAALASVFLCARAMVAVRWGLLDKVGSAVSALEPRPAYRATG